MYITCVDTLADLSSECPVLCGPVQGISGSVSEIAWQPSNWHKLGMEVGSKVDVEGLGCEYVCA